jgi:hypothetical protein
MSYKIKTIGGAQIGNKSEKNLKKEKQCARGIAEEINE